MEEASCTFAYQMSVVNILTCIQYIYTKTDHLPENILQNHGFFVTNVLNDLSPLVYLDLYEP